MQRALQWRKDSCEECGTCEKLDAHHSDGNITNNSKKNIKTLCHSCHMKLHWSLRKRGIVFGSHLEIGKTKTGISVKVAGTLV